MKNSHLTLRIPAAVARVLERMALSRGVPKSQIVREAVARYVSPGQAGKDVARTVTAAELAALWPSLPTVTSHDAKAIAKDIDRARKELSLPRDPWE